MTAEESAKSHLPQNHLLEMPGGRHCHSPYVLCEPHEGSSGATQVDMPEIAASTSYGSG